MVAIPDAEKVSWYMKLFLCDNSKLQTDGCVSELMHNKNGSCYCKLIQQIYCKLCD